MNRCPRCVVAYGETGRPSHFGSDPKCAFPDKGKFVPENWNCMTMNALRTLVEEDQHEAIGKSLWHEEYTAALLRAEADCEFIVMVWYKRRGCTSRAYILEESGMQPLRWAQAEARLQEADRSSGAETLHSTGPLPPAMGDMPCVGCGSTELKYATPKEGVDVADKDSLFNNPEAWDAYCLKCAPPEVVAAGECVGLEFEQQLRKALDEQISSKMDADNADELVAKSFHAGDLRALEDKIKTKLSEFEGERNTFETRNELTDAVLDLILELFERKADPDG